MNEEETGSSLVPCVRELGDIGDWQWGFLSRIKISGMLIRIVRMHFTEAGVAEFLRIFEDNMKAIRNFDGCSHLELMKDVEDPFTYTTLSYWRDSECLDNYRKSELFGSVWGSVKTLFAERSQAFSLEKYIVL